MVTFFPQCNKEVISECARIWRPYLFCVCSVKEVGGFYSWKTFPEFCADETSQDRYCTSQMIKHVSLRVIFLLLKQQKYFIFLVRHVDVVSLTCLYNPYVNFPCSMKSQLFFDALGFVWRCAFSLSGLKDFPLVLKLTVGACFDLQCVWDERFDLVVKNLVIQ